MLIALLSLLVAQSPVPSPEGPIYSSPSTSSSFAFFEFAPANGLGMTGACACTTPTGAKGEALTFSRTSNATCSPVGLAGAGLANNTLVTCGSGGARVEPSGGVAGLRVESTADNLLLRFVELNNPPWADVATPTPTLGQTSPWVGTFASSAVLYTDDNAAAYEGRSQTISVTATQQYTLSCWVKAGSLTAARLSLDGTTADFTGLSSTSWTLVSVTDASASAVAIEVQVLLGSVVGDTGTLTWGGCQVEAGAYPTSMITTTASVATRAGELAGFALSVPTTSGVCTAATVQVPSTAAFVGGAGLWAPQLSSGAANANVSSPYVWPYVISTGGAVAIDGNGSSGAPVGLNPATDSVLTTARARAGHDGTNWSYTYNGTTRTSVGSTWSSPTYSSVKFFAQTVTTSAAIWTRVQVDPVFTRCSPL